VPRHLERILRVGGCALLVGCGASHHDGPAPTGTIFGTVSSSLGGPIIGATVVVTPSSAPALAAATVSAAGIYRVGQVPLDGGDGKIGVGTLPSGCTIPAPTPYSGLTNGDSITVDVTVDCVAPVGTVAGTISTAVGGVSTALANIKVTVTPAAAARSPQS